MAGIQMAPKEKQPDIGPVVRWLAGLICLVFVPMAVIAAFPRLVGVDEESSILGVFVFAWAAFVFGSIAATGNVGNGGKRRRELLVAAKKYADGQLTLEEYGSRTKEILGDHSGTSPSNQTLNPTGNRPAS